MRQKKAFTICMALLPAAIFLAAAAALCMGQFRIPLNQILAEFSGAGGNPANVRTVLFNIRIPRILMALLGGAGLACAGAAFQSFFANPLATPDTLGVANGASFGAALAILLGFGAMQVQLLSFAFGVLSVLLVFSVTRYPISVCDEIRHCVPILTFPNIYYQIKLDGAGFFFPCPYSAYRYSLFPDFQFQIARNFCNAFKHIRSFGIVFLLD